MLQAQLRAHVSETRSQCHFDAYQHTLSLPPMLILLLSPEMLHSQPNSIDNADLIDLKDAEIGFLKSSRVWPVGKASPLANACDGEDIVKSSAEYLERLFERYLLRIPVGHVDFRGPDELCTVLV